MRFGRESQWRWRGELSGEIERKSRVGVGRRDVRGGEVSRGDEW